MKPQQTQPLPHFRAFQAFSPLRGAHPPPLDRFADRFPALPSELGLSRRLKPFARRASPSAAKLQETSSRSLDWTDSWPREPRLQLLYSHFLAQVLVALPLADGVHSEIKLVTEECEKFLELRAASAASAMEHEARTGHVGLGQELRLSWAAWSFTKALPVLAEVGSNRKKTPVFPDNLYGLTLAKLRRLEGTTLPSKLHSLSFSEHFNQSLEALVFPKHLQHISFGFEFNQPLDQVTLPQNLQSLRFGDRLD
ncbi:unnamed protein product [Durusdinium trenchii]|uniref:Uncharacterized protein n=1 Tax=Durusdinium trenchii TaxID=1381693 RepID=A0ABP0HYJ5_9DINO